MFIFGLLLYISHVKAVDYTFQLGPNDATCDFDPCGDDGWDWDTGYQDFNFEANEAKTFAIDFGSLTGMRDDGREATLGNHESTSLHTLGGLYSYEISGFFDCTDGEWCDEYKCEFSRSTETFTVRNSMTPQMISFRVSVDGNDDFCEAAKDLVRWWTTVLIVSGVICCLCILLAVGMCTGVIACCNNSQVNARNQAAIEAAYKNSAAQQNNVPQQTYAQQEGGSGPDLTQYSTGLAAGWEAKWDPATQRPYWVNHQTQSNTWDDPRSAHP